MIRGFCSIGSARKINYVSSFKLDSIRSTAGENAVRTLSADDVAAATVVLGFSDPPAGSMSE